MQFPTTRWDELAQASLHGDATARQALDEFCRRYWEPVNAFIRWKGYGEAEAADLTQEFFLNFVETRSWRRADRLRGRFRTFLLGALSRRLANARLHQTRLKRGGDSPPVSLEETGADADAGMTLPTVPPADAAHFDREWAIRVLAVALDAIREEYAAKGKERIFATLRVFLTATRTPPTYEQVAAELRLGLGAVKTEIHRLRQALGAALRAEISRTVSAPHEIEAEVRHLRDVLTSHGGDIDAPRET
ncbi:MAG: sigma-70 family RNA polymerase sigma factor [Opitutaceae bacterium]|nr:sigma-70 family RNA polymerase sigma factor [Opitutaceae bacterium]